jgi:GNAT superfamily N-acetyltransferase
LCSDIPNDIYFIEHHKLIRRIIQQYPVFVACCVDDPELLYGWVCAGKIEDIWCAHYVYIKQAFRKLGIAKLLLQASGYKENCAGLCTHRTAKTLPLEHSMGLIYDPYILINHLAQEIEYVEQQASK